MDKIIKLLGLSADANEESIAASIQTLQNKFSELTTAADSATKRADKAEADLLANRQSIADSDFAPFKDKVPAGTEEFWKGNLLANRDAALKSLLALTPKPVMGEVLNRAGTTVPVVATGEADTFEVLVNKHVTSGKSKSVAIDLVMASHPDAYRTWRNTGGLI